MTPAARARDGNPLALFACGGGEDPVLRAMTWRDATIDGRDFGLYEAARRVVRAALILVGLVMVLAGVLMAPLPGPFGLPVSVLGLMIVLRNSFWARRRFVSLQRRHPRFVHPLRRMMRDPRAIVAVTWQNTLRMERLVVPRRMRFLRRSRKAIRRRRAGR